nr:MAG TPA: hypothetical protein [Caudoviricetes sp.]DAS53940.1 MAG TPA: hypothetical protein [Caudoviricetes sp.]
MIQYTPRIKQPALLKLRCRLLFLPPFVAAFLRLKNGETLFSFKTKTYYLK